MRKYVQHFSNRAIRTETSIRFFHYAGHFRPNFCCSFFHVLSAVFDIESFKKDLGPANWTFSLELALTRRKFGSRLLDSINYKLEFHYSNLLHACSTWKSTLLEHLHILPNSTNVNLYIQ